MARYRHEIDIERVHVDWQLADGLDSVCVEKYFVFATDSAQFFDGLEHADFVIDHHDGGGNCVGADGSLEGFQL